MSKFVFWSMILLMVFISACQPAKIEFSPVATQNITPTVATRRWIEYERALASVLLGPSGNTKPDLSQDIGWCEWEIWGQQGNDVYIWAVCVLDNSVGTATSAPTIIRLDEDRHISAVIMPEEGWGNVDQLFPAPVLKRIRGQEFDATSAMKHIEMRKKDSSIPPLIVEQGITLP